MVRPGASAPKATVWIRLVVGWVFFWEGVIKFVFVNQGVGRFTKLGMPMPEMLAPAIAVLEIVGTRGLWRTGAPRWHVKWAPPGLLSWASGRPTVPVDSSPAVVEDSVRGHSVHRGRDVPLHRHRGEHPSLAGISHHDAGRVGPS